MTRTIPLLLAVALAGCEGEGGGGQVKPMTDMRMPSGDGDPPLDCRTDDDCDEQMVNRACREGRCQSVCPPDMTYVGAGTFTRGCDKALNTGMTILCQENAQPEHKVTLSRGFCVSKTELTVAQYRACVTAGKCPAPPELACTLQTATWTAKPENNEKLALNCLLWAEAKAACEFLGGSLPTEAQWEKAARGRDRRAYPWGESAPRGCATGVNWAGAPDCLGQVWPAGSGSGQQALSAGRALDMAGNLSEWTADWYADRGYDACGAGCTDPTGPQTGVVRTRRGGSFRSRLPQDLRSATRDYHNPGALRSDETGARCVKVP